MLIAGLSIDPPNWLAPMAGVTDSPFRTIARGLGAGAVITEMISSEGLIRSGRGTLALLRIEAAEQPIFAQIFGHAPQTMAQAAQICEQHGFAGVDVNMGCPVPKVVRHGAGAALLREPELAGRIVEAVRRSIRVPLTVKIRAGWSPEEINAVEMARRLADSGADALTLHARTRSQFYSGQADWDLIGRVVQAIPIPVIGNGDLQKPGDEQRMRAETGCAGVMVGRAALGNPWLFRAMAGGAYPPGPEEVRSVFCLHLKKMIDYVGSEDRAVLRMRKHLIWYTRGIRGASSLRPQIAQMTTAEQMAQALWLQLAARPREQADGTVGS